MIRLCRKCGERLLSLEDETSETGPPLEIILEFVGRLPLASGNPLSDRLTLCICDGVALQVDKRAQLRIDGEKERFRFVVDRNTLEEKTVIETSNLPLMREILIQYLYTHAPHHASEPSENPLTKMGWNQGSSAVRQSPF